MCDPQCPKLNLPPIKLRAKRIDGVVKVWSEVRKCYLPLTPEEWVRRHFVEFVMSTFALPATRIVEEFSVDVNGQSQRADIVVIDSMGAPQMVVECKAPTIKLTQSVVDQALRYNRVLGARYVIVTNGLSHHCIDCSTGESVVGLETIIFEKN